jgi:hypothetical protein
MDICCSYYYVVKICMVVVAIVLLFCRVFFQLFILFLACFIIASFFFCFVFFFSLATSLFPCVLAQHCWWIKSSQQRTFIVALHEFLVSYTNKAQHTYTTKALLVFVQKIFFDTKILYEEENNKSRNSTLKRKIPP